MNESIWTAMRAGLRVIACGALCCAGTQRAWTQTTGAGPSLLRGPIEVPYTGEVP